jgi:Transposase DDE domain
MVDRIKRRRFDLRPQRLAGDSVYGAARLLKTLVDRKITPHVPVWDKSARHDGTFSRSDFERKKVEIPFAHMKRILKFDRLRLRGLSGAKDEVLLTATAQNLRRLAKLLCRAPPPLPVACPS